MNLSINEMPKIPPRGHRDHWEHPSEMVGFCDDLLGMFGPYKKSYR
jgi:hypothetical protein